ncbi:MAG: polyprenyl synthetase family protein [Chloroflexota bacterium]|nr:polyprenyl synthetase family protein [Chloroflexota bacterium]
MPDRAAPPFGAAVATHLTHVCRRACPAPPDGLDLVLRWATAAARLSPFLRLPSLCCQATGGDPAHAIPVSAAWHLLHCAAHLLDDLADEAIPSLEPAQAVNAAVTLVFLAQVSLTTLRHSQVEPERVVALVAAFDTATARMALGQAADLAWDEGAATLDDYWRVAGTKTGEFFGLACRAGAMLGTQPQAEVDIYATFGYHLGVLVQLSDDFRALWTPRGRGDLTTAGRTLPVVYALTVASSEARGRLHSLLRRAPDDGSTELAKVPAALRELQATLADPSTGSGQALGALHYLTLQAGKQHHLAHEALLSSARPAVAQHELLKLLDAAFPAVAQERWPSHLKGSPNG